MQLRLFLRLVTKNFEIYSLKIITLAVAFASLVLVSVFSLNEFGYDRFHHNPEEIFRIIEKNTTETYGRNKYSSQLEDDVYNSLLVNKTVSVARTKGLNELNVIVEGKLAYNQQMHIADPAISNILSFDIEDGSIADFKEDKASLVISSDLAQQYFGKIDVADKVLSVFTFGDTLQLKVAAVYKAFPNNSHQNFKAFIHYDEESLRTLGFDTATAEVYGRKDENTPLTLPATAEKSYSTQAISDIYFGPRMAGEEVTHGDLYSVIILISITSLILFLALTSFINLTSLALPLRIKELAVKKLAGHNKLQLTLSFIGESFLVGIISFVIGLSILWVCWKYITAIQIINLAVLVTQEIFPLSLILAAFFILLTIAPLLMIQRFIRATPIRLLSSEAITFPKFKKVIIILQLGISIFLIVSAIVINRQVTYSLVKEPGRNNYQVVYVSYPDDMTDDALRRLRNGWKKSKPNIVNVMAVSQLPDQISSRDIETGVYSISVDSEFNDFFDLEMIEGSWFGANDGDSIVIVNNSAQQKLGGLTENIRGVYKDISGQFNLPEKPIKIVREGYVNHNFLCIRILEVDILKTIGFLERYFSEGEKIAKVKFMDKKFESWLNYQLRLNSFTNILTIIAGLLSCFAIYGLSISVVRDKLKQIAIRKICGADISHIIYLLVKEFGTNLIIALILFAPITYIILKELLRAFVYSTKLHWLDPTYPLAYCCFVIIVLCSWQALTLNRSDLSGALKE